jgi:hypothetical protein
MVDSHGSYDKNLVNAQVAIGEETFDDITVKEVTLGESLMTPGLQTAVSLQSFVYSQNPKIWGNFKNKDITITMADENSRFMMVNQKVYRIDNREMDLNVGQTESLTVHACDQSLLQDAKSLISKSWKCERPSTIVEYALTSCVNARNYQIDSAGPARDYIAENIHPFQVIQQQCNAALYEDENPDFLHYMTFEGEGKHYFRALKYLEDQTQIYKEYANIDGDGSTASYQRVISFSYPCDFDLLSDLLNGIDEDGQPFNSVSVMNMMSGVVELIGGMVGMGGGTGGLQGGCGIGSGNAKQALTNKGTASQQNSCNLEVEKYLLLRQARMGLLEKDKISLRMTIPWDPDMHVGYKIKFDHHGRGTNIDTLLYGSGVYLIVALKHNIQLGGFATTTVDCIHTNIG